LFLLNGVVESMFGGVLIGAMMSSPDSFEFGAEVSLTNGVSVSLGTSPSDLSTSNLSAGRWIFDGTVTGMGGRLVNCLGVVGWFTVLLSGVPFVRLSEVQKVEKMLSVVLLEDGVPLAKIGRRSTGRRNEAKRLEFPHWINNFSPGLEAADALIVDVIQTH
jgi:hypothetical protein